MYTHKKFSLVEYAAREILRDPDVTCAISLVGPPGSGKTTLGKQLADHLETNFGYVSLNNQMTMSVITGYSDAMGKFHHTDYTLTLTSGGVMMFDEADSTGRPWITLNATIANRLANINGETVRVHHNWIPIFSMNTVGRGPTPSHPDRMKLDQATMSRMFQIEIDYDWALYRLIALNMLQKRRPMEGQELETVERMVNQLAAWIEHCYTYVSSPASGIKQETYFDPRALYGLVIDVLGAEMPYRDSLECRVWKGLPKGTRDKILAECPFPSLF